MTEVESQTFLAPRGILRDIRTLMGDYPGRKQVRNRVKRAAKNDRIIEANRTAKAAAAAPAPKAKKK